MTNPEKSTIIYDVFDKIRRRRDLNPCAVSDLLVFEARPFSLLGTSPYFVKYIIYYSAFFRRLRVVKKKKKEERKRVEEGKE